MILLLFGVVLCFGDELACDEVSIVLVHCTYLWRFTNELYSDRLASVVASTARANSMSVPLSASSKTIWTSCANQTLTARLANSLLATWR